MCVSVYTDRFFFIIFFMSGGISVLAGFCISYWKMDTFIWAGLDFFFFSSLQFLKFLSVFFGIFGSRIIRYPRPLSFSLSFPLYLSLSVSSVLNRP